MSSTEQPRAPDPGAVTQSATQAALAAGPQVLGFEREQFPGFFGLQGQLTGALQSRLAAAEAGELPAPVTTAFRRALVGAQTRRGLATSPIGATEEAVGLANILQREREAAFGAAQAGLSQFRPSTGFISPIQPGQALGLAQQALTPQPDFRASQMANLLGTGAGMASAFIPGLQPFAPLIGAGVGGLAGGFSRGGLTAATSGLESGFGGGIGGLGIAPVFEEKQVRPGSTGAGAGGFAGATFGLQR